MYKKKSLGQHFLHAASHLRAVADAANSKERDVVVEIGPGDGALTQELLSRLSTSLKASGRVIALEKDHRLISVLSERFAKEIASRQLSIVEGDALEFDPKAQKLKSGEYIVVGNIPYYITGALLRKFLTEKAQPRTVVFLIQKEVAERIARSKKESLLSLSIKAYGTAKYIKTVPRGAFVPAPNVDSAILQITNVSRKHFTNLAHEEKFFELLHAGFAQKRKLLRRNLEAVLGEKTSEALERAGIPQNARAEDVALKQWLEVARV